MQNPYATPTVPVEDIEFPDHPYQPDIFSTQGRIGRLRYIVYTAIVLFVTAFVAGIAAAVLIPMLMKGGSNSNVAVFAMLAVYIPVLYGMVVMIKRRLHDLNHTGWLAILMFLPLVNIVMSLYLLFWPGSKGSNEYGPAPAKNPLGLVLFALVLLLVNIGFVVFALGAYQDYVQRAQATQLQMQMRQSQP
jgi:uncharacterized membrane protein YhaH (DUF805 family)